MKLQICRQAISLATFCLIGIFTWPYCQRAFEHQFEHLPSIKKIPNAKKFAFLRSKIPKVEGEDKRAFERQSFRRIGGNNFDVMMLYCGGFGSLGLLPALSFFTEVGCFSLLEGAFSENRSKNLASYIDGRVVWSSWAYAKKACVDSTSVDGQLTSFEEKTYLLVIVNINKSFLYTHVIFWPF